ncbi:hypothetical protein D3C71_2076400 [compost metagenome]
MSNPLIFFVDFPNGPATEDFSFKYLPQAIDAWNDIYVIGIIHGTNCPIYGAPYDEDLLIDVFLKD